MPRPSMQRSRKGYDFRKAEKKWHAAWRREGVYEPKFRSAKKPYYNLMMFPYPSAEGLHIGAVRTYSGVDIYGRLKRMQGFDVFEPIGLDGFGIHSENFALKVGRHPAVHARISERNFYRQLDSIGNGFAWKERLETYDPEYYRWTQWVFTRLFKAGLAYRKKQAVNWCPKDQTVLADEQVEGGLCERCGAVAEKRELEQWFFRITKYADRLLANLDRLDWTEKVKIAQRNWIGKSQGINIEYEVVGRPEKLVCFTTTPVNFGATFIVISPEHPLALELSQGEHRAAAERYIADFKKVKKEAEELAKEKTGVFTGSYALNHVTGEKLPIWIADFVLTTVGTGAVQGCPGHDMRDFEFAKKYGLPIRRVVVGEDGDMSPIERAEQVVEKGANGTMVNSGFLDGMKFAAAMEKTKDQFEAQGWGRRVTTYRLRDWLISRQRYWGPPIPMIFCDACAAKGKGERKDMPGWYAVPDKDLPVRLPQVKDFQPRGTGQSPLASVKSFYVTKCPSCKSRARRETDVSDTFLDSAWYYLRYPNAGDKKRAWDPAITKKWFPVDMYIGGPEHSVLHLLYVRFVALAFHDMGLLKSPKRSAAPAGEPFPAFRAHGLITKDGAKMSKSKGNVVNPDEYLQRYGADVMRMYLAFLAPLTQGGDFRDEGISGITRFLDRFWRFVSAPDGRAAADAPEATRLLHRTVKKVGEDIESLQYNTAISALMVCLNELEGHPLSRAGKEVLVKLLAPFAPFMAETAWREVFGRKRSIHRESWPKYDARRAAEETLTIVVQVNGRLRATLTGIAPGASQKEIERLALADAKVAAAMEGGAPRKVIYVPGRVLNIVV